MTHETISNVTRVRFTRFVTWKACSISNLPFQALESAPYSFNTAVADMMKLSNKLATGTHLR